LKSGFQNRKPDFAFKTKNRISGFRLTSLVVIKHFLVEILLKSPVCHQQIQADKLYNSPEMSSYQSLTQSVQL